MADHLRGPDNVLALVRGLLRDVWVLDTVESIPDSFRGVAVTRGGRVWSSATRELRQAPAVGEERVLAERNRRDELIRVSETAAQAELAAKAALDRAGDACHATELARDQPPAAHRAPVDD